MTTHIYHSLVVCAAAMLTMSASVQAQLTITRVSPLDTVTTAQAGLRVNVPSGSSCRYSYTEDSYELMESRTTLGSTPYIWLLNDLDEGDNTVNVACKNLNGAEGRLPIRFTVNAPITTDFPDTIHSRSAFFRVNAPNGSSCRYSTETDSYNSMRGATLTNSPYVWFIGSLTNGEKTYYVACKSRTSERKLTMRFTVAIPGQEAPSDITTDFPDTIHSRSAFLTVNASAGSSCKYSTSTDSYSIMESRTLDNNPPYVWFIPGLTNGEKTYYVACRRGDYERRLAVRFTVAIPGQEAPSDTVARAPTLVLENRVRASGGGVTDSLLYQVYVSRLPIPVGREFSIVLKILSRGVWDGSRRIDQSDGIAGLGMKRMEFSLIVPDGKVDVRKFRTMNFYNMNSASWDSVGTPDETYQIAENVIGPALRFMMGFIPVIGSDLGLLQSISSASGSISGTRTYSLKERTRVMEFEAEYDIIPVPLDPIPGDGLDYRNLNLGGYEFVMPMTANTTDAEISLSLGPIKTAKRNIDDDQAEFAKMNIPVRLNRLAETRSRGPITAPGAGVARISGSPGTGGSAGSRGHDNSLYELAVAKPAAMAPDADVPQTTQLNLNYPNPFNPETTIPFTVGRDESGEHAKLAVYNMLGQEVVTLVDEPLPAGNYSAKWDGMDANGNSAGSGIYLCKLQVGRVAELKKMLTLQ